MASLPILNQRLKIYGYETIGELIHDFIKEKFPPIHDDEELKSLKAQLTAKWSANFFIRIISIVFK